MVSLDQPLWLVLPLAAGLLAWRVSLAPRRTGLPGDWPKVIETPLHEHSARNVKSDGQQGVLPWLVAISCLISLALTNPRLDQDGKPAIANMAGRVILVDLGAGIDPVAQRLAIAELLNGDEGMPTALMVASGDSFEAVPLTTDYAQIRRYAGVLEPGLMPLGGRLVQPALEHASGILSKAGVLIGQVIWITGGNPPTPLPPQQGPIGRAVVLAEGDGQVWGSWADSSGLALVETGEADELLTSLQSRIQAFEGRLVEDGPSLRPWLIALAGLFWLALFRREAA